MDHGNSLLLTCLGKDRREEKIAKLKNLDEKDWTAVLSAASHFGVTPLLFDALKPFLSELKVPASAQR